MEPTEPQAKPAIRLNFSFYIFLEPTKSCSLLVGDLTTDSPVFVPGRRPAKRCDTFSTRLSGHRWIPSHQLTWKCKKALSKRKVVFLQGSVHCHVSWREGMGLCHWLTKLRSVPSKSETHPSGCVVFRGLLSVLRKKNATKEVPSNLAEAPGYELRLVFLEGGCPTSSGVSPFEAARTGRPIRRQTKAQWIPATRVGPWVAYQASGHLGL